MEDDGSRYVWAHHRHSSAFSFLDQQQWWQQHILGWAKNKNCYEHLGQRYKHEHEQDRIRIHDFLQFRTMFMLSKFTTGSFDSSAWSRPACSTEDAACQWNRIRRNGCHIGNSKSTAEPNQATKQLLLMIGHDRTTGAVKHQESTSKIIKVQPQGTRIAGGADSWNRSIWRDRSVKKPIDGNQEYLNERLSNWNLSCMTASCCRWTCSWSTVAWHQRLKQRKWHEILRNANDIICENLREGHNASSFSRKRVASWVAYR